MTTSQLDFDNPLNHSSRLAWPDWQDASYVVYFTIMFVILTTGFLGNLVTIIVLYQPYHRKQTLAPPMLSLALGDLFVIVFGYPTMMTVILSGQAISADNPLCSWYALVNGTVGIASIATFTSMTIVLSYSMHQMNPAVRVSRKTILSLIAASWFWGVVLMLPPFFGWNSFVPGASGIGCAPNWTDESPAGMTYSLLLIVVGFCGPILAISISYFKICRLLRRDKVTQRENIRIKLRRRRWQMSLLRLTTVAIAAFTLSWSPYCLVSLISAFRGNNVLSAGEAEVPALMAKASVIYNPIVYTVMNRRFRMTLWRYVSYSNCKKNCYCNSHGPCCTPRLKCRMETFVPLKELRCGNSIKSVQK